MSRYKEELKLMLAGKNIAGESCLSIGNKVDDKTYFGSTEFDTWLTLDNDPEFNPDIEWNMNRPMTSEENEGFFHDFAGYFDYVLGLNLWEYIYDPLTAHKNIQHLLKPGGTYMGSYVFVYGKHNPVGTDYLRYTDEGIDKLLRMSFFKDIQIEPIKCSDSLTDFYLGEGMRIRKDVDHNVAGYLVTARK